LTVLVAVATACDAQAVRGRLADVAVIDRETGAALGTHYYRGEYWVAGRPGARYAVEVRNRTGERLLAVMAVDGINVLSGATAAWDQTGYVFAPGDRYQISGWRKSDSEVAAFTFTDSPNSYAARTGRPANVGVIGVALFCERLAEPLYVAPLAGQSGKRMEGSNPSPAAGTESGSSALPADADAASGAHAPRAAAGRPSASAPMQAAQSAPVPGATLGTGHGEREYSYVEHTDFVRLQAQPNAVVRIRYDSLENLVAMGIVAQPRPPWPRPDPFPGSPEQRYVPDPPG
jgi:hypothetical protein